MADEQVMLVSHAMSELNLRKSESDFDLQKDANFGRNVTASTDASDGCASQDLEDSKPPQRTLPVLPERCKKSQDLRRSELQGSSDSDSEDYEPPHRTWPVLPGCPELQGSSDSESGDYEPPQRTWPVLPGRPELQDSCDNESGDYEPPQRTWPVLPGRPDLQDSDAGYSDDHGTCAHQLGK
eukprot:TRINITY_DN2212_c0_g1_i2.p2 TRINITY_DN2212_c0_g1~~TRINITY_DN2212_c0_g1_i2.p2  ORF type:complete len:182 (+),score=20.27 TRINITY_DN2212_c0_g1_i2:68-613(+)